MFVPRRFLATLVATALLAVSAAASPVSDAIGTLTAAQDARVAAIGASSSTRALARERVSLGRSSSALAAFTGTDLVADLASLKRAGRALGSSRTQDPDVIAAAAGVADCLLADAEAIAAEAASAAALMSSASAYRRVLKLLTKSRALATSAAAQAHSDPVGAIALLLKAAKKARAASVVAQGALQLGPRPADVHVYRTNGSRGITHLYNATGAPISVRDVRFEVVATYFSGVSKPFVATHTDIMFKFEVVAPSTFVPADGFFDVWTDGLFAVLGQFGDTQGTTVSSFTGRAVVTIDGHAPFAVGLETNQARCGPCDE